MNYKMYMGDAEWRKSRTVPALKRSERMSRAARKAKQLSRSALADMIHCDSRYLANIENEGTLPSLPVVIQLIKICGLPVERYFNPELMREESAERQRVSHKLQLCPEEYLPIVEGAIDGALRIHEQEKEPVCV